MFAREYQNVRVKGLPPLQSGIPCHGEEEGLGPACEYWDRAAWILDVRNPSLEASCRTYMTHSVFTSALKLSCGQSSRGGRSPWSHGKSCKQAKCNGLSPG